MATSDLHGSPPRRMRRHANSGLLLISTLLIVALEFHSASAQQQYNNVSGYQCTDAATSCQAYAYYRTQGTNSTLNSTALLFNTSAAAIANASALNTLITTPLADGSPLYIPLTCGCYNGTYQAPTTKVVTAGETMSSIASITFQGLVTYQAIMAANTSIVPELMQIGTKLKVPLRCACPTAAQRAAGTQFLLTYAVFPNETLTSISERLNVSLEEVQAANTRVNTTVEAFTTVLVPLKGLSSNGSNPTGPAPPPSAASRGSQAHLLVLVTLLAGQSLFF